MKKLQNSLLLFLHTFKISLGMSFIFILIEQLYRIYNPILTFNLSIDTVGELLLINFLILSLSNKKIIIGIYIFIFTLISAQLLHFSYYGSWIFPLEYLLFFTKFHETLETFSTVLDLMLTPLAIIFIGIPFAIYLLRSLKDRRFIIPYLGYIWIVLVIFIPGRIYIDDMSKKGARPNVEVNPLRNAIETLGYLAGHIAPKLISGKNTLAQKVIERPKQIENNPDANVILIMGESLNRNFMSLYGYKKETTPFLDSLEKEPTFIYKKGISSGVYTDVSLPSFFNMIYRPDGLPQILSTNTCLFKMAKENGFKTHFFSSQSQDALSNIKSYLCTRWMDTYSDGSKLTGDIHHTDRDGNLLEKLQKVDLSKSNFVVLHQVGSHSPYNTRYPSSFDKFKDTDDKRAAYENSILYTDYVIKKIADYLKKHSLKTTYLIFTSDHGESVGVNGRYGHGNIEFTEQHQVPFFIYGLHVKNNQMPKLSNSDFISHFEMAKVVAKTLGYDTENIYNKSECYVCGADISGLAGYLKIETSKEKAKITAIK
jgi:glucan phosphoethanolaminetransferase (alkaline phosphatase superfamily)